MRVVIDASDTMAALGEVAVWSFDLDAWGECTQGTTEATTLAAFAARVGTRPELLRVGERITRPAAVFREDLSSATGAQIDRTLEILEAQRRRTLAMLDAATAEQLDAEDDGVIQPTWMPWRTPRGILRHIVDTESRAYPRWCGLPELEPIDDLRSELDRSAEHVRAMLTTMPRSFRTQHRGETWTPVKLLRRLAWHERVERVYLQRRLRVSLVPDAAST